MTRKTTFFEGWSWFKFNNLGLALGKNLKFYTSLPEELKLKVRKFWVLILTFVEVTGEKLVAMPLWPPLPPPSILNRVNEKPVSEYTSPKILKLKLVRVLLELTERICILKKKTLRDISQKR